MKTSIAANEIMTMKKLIGIFATLAFLVPVLGTGAVALAGADLNVPTIAEVDCDKISAASNSVAVGGIEDDELCAEPEECVIHATSCCVSVTPWCADSGESLGASEGSSHGIADRLALTGIAPGVGSGPPKPTT